MSIASTATSSPTPNHFMLGVLKTHSRVEDVVSRQADLLQRQIAQDFAEMDRLEKEKTDKMSELSVVSWSSRIWTPISTAFQYISNAASVVLGSSAILRQGYQMAHVVLVASGVAGLAHRILQDTALLKIILAQFSTSQQLHERVANHLDMGNLCLSIGLGVIGGMWAHQAGLLPLVGTFNTQAVSSMFLLGAKVGQNALKVKISLIRREEQRVTALIQRVQASISQVFQSMRDSCKNAENILQTSGNIHESMQQAVASLYSRSYL